MLFINIYVSEFTEQAAAKDDLWVLGDDFTAAHMMELLVRQPLRRRNEDFTVTHFDVYTAAVRSQASPQLKCHITHTQRFGAPFQSS